jgi:hypothetical protein
MFKLRLIGTLILAALLAGCFGGVIRGSGNLVTQEMDFADFDKLNVSNGFLVHVQQGETFSVIVRADDNMIDRVLITKQGSTLKIGLKPGWVYKKENVTLEADVTMPSLNRVDLRSGGHLTGEVEVGNVTVNLSDSSHVILSGSAGDLVIKAGGGSHAKLGDFEVVNADVVARGASHVTVNLTGQLDAIARGGSDVKFIGTPTMGTIDDDGSSRIQKQQW